jgi:glucose-1-phosphate cytidylyltransferase
MKVVILAGGYGTRLSEETDLTPKPMVKIGNMPILWHIMKIYSYYNFNEFIICLGYKGEQIKNFFINYSPNKVDDTFLDFSNPKKEFKKNILENWKIHLVDTGKDTVTGGRLKRVKELVGKDDFCFTYGDGLTNANILEVANFHKNNKKLATVLAVQPPERFGVLDINKENGVDGFFEKYSGTQTYINGGFFVLSPKVIDFIEGDHISWEREPVTEICNRKEMIAFKHHDFWYAMDTLKDKRYLNDLWEKNIAPWKVW